VHDVLLWSEEWIAAQDDARHAMQIERRARTEALDAPVAEIVRLGVM
jgi:hypothetical protein